VTWTTTTVAVERTVDMAVENDDDLDIVSEMIMDDDAVVDVDVDVDGDDAVDVDVDDDTLEIVQVHVYACPVVTTMMWITAVASVGVVAVYRCCHSHHRYLIQMLS
jgi:hypothetical protein